VFVDEIKIYAQAGHGGKGCVAFQREKYRPKGGPSGGNGGRGGDVILEADHDLNNLIAQYYQPRLIAPDGKQGLGKGMDGHAGKDLLVKVPCGTLIWRVTSDAQPADSGGLGPLKADNTLRMSSSQRPLLRASASGRAMEVDLSREAGDEEAAATASKTGAALETTAVGLRPRSRPRPRSADPFDHEDEDESRRGEVTLSHQAGGELVADLTEHGQRLVLCKGGRGGLGNRNFATATRQAPRFAQPGEPGEAGDFRLELRMIADVGLVGYPNAGKSTLLRAISHAWPKVAPYPFTTLHPQIGIVEYPDFYRLTVCDVPGLIEGAHRNVGLGHAFLRHIERCKVLVVLLDMAGEDGRAPWDDYRNLLNELGLYDPALLDRQRLVVANKMDEAVAEANLKKFKRRIRTTPVLPIAAAFDEGIAKFRKMIREAVTGAE
jgi:GTP-binding protein